MAHIKTGSKWVRLEFPNPIKQAVCIFWNTCCEVCACTYADSLFCTALHVHITEKTWEPLSGPLQAETTSMESIKLQLHVPSMIQTTGNKKSLLRGPKLTTCWKIHSRDLGKPGVNYEGNDFPMQDQGEFLGSTGTALSLPARVTWGNAGNPNTKMGCAFPTVTLQAHCSEMQVLKACPCLTVLLLCLKAFIFSSYTTAYYRIQNQTVQVFLWDGDTLVPHFWIFPWISMLGNWLQN